MPLYYFENPITLEVKELFFGMNDDKKYTSEDGTEWKRLYTIPAASVDGKLSPSLDSFQRYTSNKEGTLGDLMDLSRELSEARADKNGGLDPVKEKFYENYAKERNGKKHRDVILREIKESLDKKGIEVSFD